MACRPGYGRPVSAAEPLVTRPTTSAPSARSSVPAAAIGRWGTPAWVVMGATMAFVAITCWWLTQDRSIPIYDAGDQLRTALEYRDMLAGGNLLGPLTHPSLYPPLAHLVGALAAFVGGVNVAAPIIGENVVFVSLLALGCYQTGRLVALGSPLVISLFHMFLLDGPLAALVSVAVWLILDSEDFSRPRVCALAGLAVGLGMDVKVQLATFVVGLIAVALLHGGWRNRRGFAIFTLVTLAVGLPWYLIHAGELGRLLEEASGGYGLNASRIPATLSIDNLTWYLWSVLNSQLFLPLFLLAAVGTVWTLASVVRDRRAHAARLEFMAAAFLAWLIITFVTPKHDIRYGAPLIAFVAVTATGWIPRAPRAIRVPALALLALGVCANTLAISFGVGPEAIAKSSSLPGSEQVIAFSRQGFLVSAPSRDGDVIGLLKAIRREGVRTVAWSYGQSTGADFSYEGLYPLARIAGLTPAFTRELAFSSSASTVTLVHEPVTASAPPPCTRLSDGTGVWIVRYDAAAGRLALYCPTRRPRFYASGAVS